MCRDKKSKRWRHDKEKRKQDEERKCDELSAGALPDKLFPDSILLNLCYFMLYFPWRPYKLNTIQSFSNVHRLQELH